MKIRLEVIDGTEKTSIEFGGRDWKKYLIKFINSIDDNEHPSTESSFDIPSNQDDSQTVQQPVQQLVKPAPQQPLLKPFQEPVSQLVQQPVQQNLQYYPPLQQPLYYYYLQPPQYQSPTSQPLQPHLQTLQTVPLPPNQSPQPRQCTSNPVAKPQNRFSMHNRLSDSTLTINERLELFLKYEYPRVWFTSHDVQQHYERVYGNIKLSTVSTYLSRMYSRCLLERRGNRTQREYKYIADEINENEKTEFVSVSETVRI